MRKDTIEGSLSLKKSTVISSDTCGDCRSLFENVEYTYTWMFILSTREGEMLVSPKWRLCRITFIGYAAVSTAKATLAR